MCEIPHFFLSFYLVLMQKIELQDKLVGTNVFIHYVLFKKIAQWQEHK